MIPVKAQPEPKDFDKKVRKPGMAWLKRKGISPDKAPPKAGDLPTEWTKCLHDLWQTYNGTCAYLAIYFQYVSGAATVDHFIPKSHNAGAAYDWSNFRLSCLGANRKKGVKTILDPFKLKQDTFQLNLLSGEIKPNATSLNKTDYKLAQDTIADLGLNTPNHKQMRCYQFNTYLQHQHEPTLKQQSPFVWYEAKRQRLL